MLLKLPYLLHQLAILIISYYTLNKHPPPACIVGNPQFLPHMRQIGKGKPTLLIIFSVRWCIICVTGTNISRPKCKLKQEIDNHIGLKNAESWVKSVILWSSDASW